MFACPITFEPLKTEDCIENVFIPKEYILFSFFFLKWKPTLYSHADCLILNPLWVVYGGKTKKHLESMSKGFWVSL